MSVRIPIKIDVPKVETQEQTPENLVTIRNVLALAADGPDRLGKAAIDLVMDAKRARTFALRLLRATSGESYAVIATTTSLAKAKKIGQSIEAPDDDVTIVGLS